MNTYEDYPIKERKQRGYIDLLREFIQDLPAETYNNNRVLWDTRLAVEESILDDMIDSRLHPVEEAYQIEQFTDAWCDERIDTGLITLNDHYRPATLGDDDDIPF